MAGTPVPAAFPDLVPEISARIDGNGERRLLVDSGSPITFLDGPAFPGLADGKHQVELAAFGLTFPSFTLASWNAFGGEDSITGIVGGDLLRHFAFTLDYQGGRVWLDDPYDPAARPADVRAQVEASLPMEVKGGGTFTLQGSCASSGCGTLHVAPTRVMLKVTFESQTTPVWVVVDTGASGMVMDEALLTSLGDAAGRPRLEGAVFGTVDGAVRGFHSRVWRVRLGTATGGGSVAVDDVAVMVAPDFDVLDGVSNEVGVRVHALVGGSLLRYFLTTLDYQEGELRLARYDQPSHVDPDEWIGIGLSFQRDGDEWLVREAYTNHDAYMKGVRRGDVVEEINGVPVRGQSGEVIDGALAGLKLGDDVEVRYRRDAALISVRVLVEDLLPHYAPPR